MRNDVEPRATDDRLCEPCFQKNEEELAALKRRNNGRVTTATPNTTPTTSTNRRKFVSSNHEIYIDDTAELATRAKTLSDGSQSARHQSKDAASSNCQGEDDSCRLGYEELRNQVAQLASTVDRQGEMIAKLPSLLQFVLSFLDIPQWESASSLLIDPKLQSTEASSRDDKSNIAAILMSNKEAKFTSTNHHLNSKTFAEIVKQTVRSISQDVNKTRQEGVTAMYIGQDDEPKRANSFTLTGLPSDGQESNGKLVHEICHYEFGIDKVLSCK
jgi:hypothetical protein